MTKILSALPDVLIVAGSTAVSVGASMLHPAAGWIVAGTFALTFGVLGALRSRQAAD